MAKLIRCKVCGKDIASTVKKCPHCGGNNKKPIGIIGILFLSVFAFIVFITAISSGTSSNSSRSTTMAPRKNFCFVHKTVNVRKGPSSNQECLGSITIDDSIEVLQEADEGWAKVRYKGQEAYVYGTLLKQKSIHEIRGGAILRGMYNETLRNHFLDKGMNVKVYVGGKNKDRLTLTYVLAGAVFAHQLSKSPLFREWINMGFTRVTLRDGSSYNPYEVYWDLN